MMKWKHQKTDFSGDSDVESSLAVLDRVLSEFDDIETDSMCDGSDEPDAGGSRRASLSTAPAGRSAGSPPPVPVGAPPSLAVPPPPVDRSTKPRPGSAGTTPAASWRSGQSSVDRSTLSQRDVSDAPERAPPARRPSSKVNGLVRSFETSLDSSRESSPPQGVVRTTSSAQKPRQAELRPRRTQSETRFGDPVATRALVPPPVRQIGPPPTTRPPPPPPPGAVEPAWSSAARRRSEPMERAARSRQRMPSGELAPPPPPLGKPVLPPLPSKLMLRQKSSPHITYIPANDPRRRSLPAKEAIHSGISHIEHSAIESKIKRLSLNFEPNAALRPHGRSFADMKHDYYLERRATPERQTDVPAFTRAESRERSPSPSSTIRSGGVGHETNSSRRPFASHTGRSHRSTASSSSAAPPPAASAASEPAAPEVSGHRGAVASDPAALEAFIAASAASEPVAPEASVQGGVGGVSDAPADAASTSRRPSSAGSEARPSLPAKQLSARARDERRPPARRKRDRTKRTATAAATAADAAPPPPLPEEAEKQISLLLSRTGSLAETPTSTWTGSGSGSTLGSTASARAQHGQPAGSAGRPRGRSAYRAEAEAGLRPSRPAPAPPAAAGPITTLQRQASAPALSLTGSVSSRHSDRSATGGSRVSRSFRDPPAGGFDADNPDMDADRGGTGVSRRHEPTLEEARTGSRAGEVNGDAQNGSRIYNYTAYRDGADSGDPSIAGPTSLPPSLALEDPALQTTNSFPKKMPIFSPIVKDRLNDNTNMYIPAPPSPRPDYYDSELSETDSLTRDGSDAEQLFALNEKRSSKKASTSKLGANKISPPMHRKNKVKESKERHKSKKEKPPEALDVKTDSKGKKEKKKQSFSSRQLLPSSSAPSKDPTSLPQKLSSTSQSRIKPMAPRAPPPSKHPPSSAPPAPRTSSGTKKQPPMQKLPAQTHPLVVRQISAPAKTSSSRKHVISSPKAGVTRSISSPKPPSIKSASTASSPSPKEVKRAASCELKRPKKTISSATKVSVTLAPVILEASPELTAPILNKQQHCQEKSSMDRPELSATLSEAVPKTDISVKPPSVPPTPPPLPPPLPQAVKASPTTAEVRAEAEPSTNAALEAGASEETVEAVASKPPKTPLQAMIEDFHKNLPPPPAFDDMMNVSLEEPVSLAEEVEMEPDDSYYSDDSLDFTEAGGERRKRSARRRRRKSDWATTTSFDYVHRKEARKKIPEKLTHRDEGISSLESHNSASDDNDPSRRAARVSVKAAVEATARATQDAHETPAKQEVSNAAKAKNKFDSIRKLLKEGRLEGLEAPPPDFVPPPPPAATATTVKSEDPAPSPTKEVEPVRTRGRDAARTARPRSHSQPSATLIESSTGHERKSESPREVRSSQSFIHPSAKSSPFYDYRRPAGVSSPVASSGSTSSSRRRPAPRPDAALRLRSGPERSESPLRRNRPVRPPEGVQVNPLTHARPGVPPSPLVGLSGADSLHSSLPPVLRASGGKGAPASAAGARGHLTLPGERYLDKRDIRRADSLTVHKKEREADSSKFKFSIFKGFWRRKQYSLEQV